MSDEYRIKIDERAGSDMCFKLFQLTRKFHSLLPIPIAAGATAGMIQLPV